MTMAEMSGETPRASAGGSHAATSRSMARGGGGGRSSSVDGFWMLYSRSECRFCAQSPTGARPAVSGAAAAAARARAVGGAAQPLV
jgi:hypothetical protein